MRILVLVSKNDTPEVVYLGQVIKGGYDDYDKMIIDITNKLPEYGVVNFDFMSKDFGLLKVFIHSLSKNNVKFVINYKNKDVYVRYIPRVFVAKMLKILFVSCIDYSNDVLDCLSVFIGSIDEYFDIPKFNTVLINLNSTNDLVFDMLKRLQDYETGNTVTFHIYRLKSSNEIIDEDENIDLILNVEQVIPEKLKEYELKRFNTEVFGEKGYEQFVRVLNDVKTVKHLIIFLNEVSKNMLNKR